MLLQRRRVVTNGTMKRLARASAHRHVARRAAPTSDRPQKEAQLRERATRDAR